ncbi:hypothetical protein Barb6_03904 [Bacteroidales bacterium Barb6]|nr:hypothetical protein Barb4_05529 [Bacteroidales bacterium Barb4]OAV63224.1 hypothetical protein Barb6_03904 [Bacteroidales bacterium Barb6]OAV75924.1 hypothetical protein Barb7_00409 [Bacteroidales bacterium Barb7]
MMTEEKHSVFWTKTNVPVNLRITHLPKTEKHDERFIADHVGKIEFVHQLQNLLSVLYDIELDFSFLKTDFEKQ